MPRYIVFPIEVSPTAVAEDAYEYIQDNIPGWEPNTGSLDVIITEAMSLEAATVRELARNVTTAIFRWFGATLMGIDPLRETFATVDSTWTAIDALGHTLEAGTQVGIPDNLGNLFVFTVAETITLTAGTTTTAEGAVTLEAAQAGSASSGLGSDGLEVELVSILDWVDTVTLEGTTSGGVDAETDDVYLDRLVDRLRLLSQRPILPADFEAWARTIGGVQRALAIDNYNPNDDTFDNERMVTVAIVDIAGNPLSTSTKNQVDILLESIRELNFVVWVIDPTYTAVDVSFSIKVLDTFDSVQVVSDVGAALMSYLDPSNWGSVDNDPRVWRRITDVRYLEISTVINNVQGVDYISFLQIGTGGSMGTSDVSLTGPAPLPLAGDILGNAT